MQRRDFVAQASVTPALAGIQLDRFRASKLQRVGIQRFPMVHVKDMGAKQEMVDLGAGTIDFRTIFARGAGIEHYFVEHDEPKDSLAFAKRAANYLKNLSY